MGIKLAYFICCFLAGILSDSFKNAMIAYLIITALFYGTGVL